MGRNKPLSLELSKQEDLSLLQDCLLGKVQSIKEAQLHSMQRFVEFAVGNLELNAILRADVENSLNLTQSMKDSLSYFTYKTRNIDIDEAEKNLEKLSRAYEAISQGKPVAEKDKLTLKEFAVINDLSGATAFLNALNSKGLLQGSEKLERLHKNANKAKALINDMSAQVQQELGAVGPGVIVLENIQKSSTVKRKSLTTFFEKVMDFFVKHSHAAVIHAPKEFGGRALRSEIFQRTKVDNYNIKIAEHLESDTYKINVSALIPDDKHEVMRQTYGDDWQAKIATKYKLIENNIHSHSALQRFGNLEASQQRDQVKAGLADITPFGHKKIMKNDFEEIHRKVMSNHYADQDNPQMLCSEFAAVTLIGALVELDKQIKNDVNHQRRAEGLAPIPKQEDIVKIPIGKHEDLHKLHPTRLLKILKGYKCVEPVVTKSNQYITTAAKEVVKSVKSHFALKHSSSASKTKAHVPSTKKASSQRKR